MDMEVDEVRRMVAEGKMYFVRNLWNNWVNMGGSPIVRPKWTMGIAGSHWPRLRPGHGLYVHMPVEVLRLQHYVDVFGARCVDCLQRERLAKGTTNINFLLSLFRGGGGAGVEVRRWCEGWGGWGWVTDFSLHKKLIFAVPFATRLSWWCEEEDALLVRGGRGGESESPSSSVSASSSVQLSEEKEVQEDTRQAKNYPVAIDWEFWNGIRERKKKQQGEMGAGTLARDRYTSNLKQ